MADWKGQSRGNKAGYGIFIAILKKLGVVPAYVLLVFVAAYYYCFSWKSSRPLWYYFRERMGFSVARSLGSLYRNYYWFGQALIDRIVMMAGIPNQFTFNFDGEQHLHKMVAE